MEISSKRLYPIYSKFRNEIVYNDPETGEIKVYKVSDKTSVSFTQGYRAADTDCLTPAAGGLSVPHSASFLDLDGDCMPDLFLTKTDANTSDTRYEIYI